MDCFLQALINGLLLGGVYAAYSAGFSLIFGVMGVVNLAHGELIMLGAYTWYWMFVFLKIDPYLSAPFAALFLFIFGYLLQKLIINRVIDLPHIMSYILTFGIHLMIANIALKLWTHDFRNHNHVLFRSQRRVRSVEHTVCEAHYVSSCLAGHSGIVGLSVQDGHRPRHQGDGNGQGRCSSYGS